MVGAVQHIVGGTDSVHVPKDVEEAARAFLLSERRAEILVFHNHPSSWFNAIFDNLPIASSADRGLMVRARYVQPVMALKYLLGLGGARFYVGENGFVREFRIPGLLQVLSTIERLQPLISRYP